MKLHKINNFVVDAFTKKRVYKNLIIDFDQVYKNIDLHFKNKSYSKIDKERLKERDLKKKYDVNIDNSIF